MTFNARVTTRTFASLCTERIPAEVCMHCILISDLKHMWSLFKSNDFWSLTQETEKNTWQSPVTNSYISRNMSWAGYAFFLTCGRNAFFVGECLKSSSPQLITPHQVKNCQTCVSTHRGLALLKGLNGVILLSSWLYSLQLESISASVAPSTVSFLFFWMYWQEHQ